MAWFLSSWKSLRRPSGKPRRAPKRNRSLMLEDLEGRRLLSRAIQPLVTLPANTSNIISGPDGDLWVGVNSSPDTAAIERIGLDGTITSFPVPGNAPDGGFSINALTVGPDGNVWFDANFAPTFTDNQVVIGNVTPAGLVTEFPPIPVAAGRGAMAGSIVSGPGGDLWFGYLVGNLKLQDFQRQDFIGQVTTAGAVTLFPISSFSSKSPILIDSLAVGADGNLWFTEGVGKPFVFGRMSPSGVVTRFPMRNVFVGEVENGPNGGLILDGLKNDLVQNEVVQVSTSGAITRDKIPAAISNAFRTYLGPADGSFWFSNGISGSFQIGRVTASGVATSYNLSKLVPERQHFVDSMALGQDGNLYVLDNGLGEFAQNTTTVYRVMPSELGPVG